MLRSIVSFFKRLFSDEEINIEVNVEIDIIDLIFMLLLIGITIYALLVWL